MRINLTPIRSDERLTLSVSGGILIVNGTAVDLSQPTSNPWVMEGSTEAEATVLLPHGPNPPDETAFPEPITVKKDGPITLPPYDAS